MIEYEWKKGYLLESYELNQVWTQMFIISRNIPPNYWAIYPNLLPSSLAWWMLECASMWFALAPFSQLMHDPNTHLIFTGRTLWEWYLHCFKNSWEIFPSGLKDVIRGDYRFFEVWQHYFECAIKYLKMLFWTGTFCLVINKGLSEHKLTVHIVEYSTCRIIYLIKSYNVLFCDLL